MFDMMNVRDANIVNVLFYCIGNIENQSYII